MKSKVLLAEWLIVVIFVLSIIGGLVYKIDPYFHYHKPDTEAYFYTLYNQRSQNDGISKYFEYDALITGTSMIENFKTSEMDKIFNVNSIKVPFSGGSYKKINDNIETALKYNKKLKTIVRGLDTGRFFDDSNTMRYDLGTYPTYLYDNDSLNDLKYIFNKDVFERTYRMVRKKNNTDFKPGITSFDDYSRWESPSAYGVDAMSWDGITSSHQKKVVHITDMEKATIKENIEKNVTSLADEYPNVSFYYFFTPYSVLWWNDLANDGTIFKQIEAEKYIIELILEHPNIYLYSFNNRLDITADLNNYADILHYGSWINSLILKWMNSGDYLLTKNNYVSYLEKEFELYYNFDYERINEQEDYESDLYAAALFNQELYGEEPIDLLKNDTNLIEQSDAMTIENEYCGIKFTLSDIGDHNYLVFYGKRKDEKGQPTVIIYNKKNEKIAEFTDNYTNIDGEWHQFTIALTKLERDITVFFSGGYIENTENAPSPESVYFFRDVTLY